MKELIKNCFIDSLKENKNTFDILEYRIAKYYDKPCTNLYEIKQRSSSSKKKGDLFELFCKIYLTNLNKYTNVWLLSEVPKNILDKLGLKRVDMGIDIICNKDENFYAFQAKFRKNNGKRHILPWNSISTFYALCFNSGPWKECYVITNCNNVHHAVRGNKQKSICLHTFRNISNDLWIKMYSDSQTEFELEKKDIERVNLERVREARLKRFSINNIC